MQTVTSISGGQSSAYVAANYPAHFLLFALVCVEDRSLTPKDAGLVKQVSDKIGREFIGTVEDDTILHTILDLEQYLGQRIDWVAGEPFEKVIDSKGGYLPNKMARYCTTEMKLRPLFRFWRDNIKEPVTTQIGFRCGESSRAETMLDKCNEDGLLGFKDIVGKTKDGRNKWATTFWQKPAFPMLEDGIRKDHVIEYWKDKPVRFAERNNCIGCFWRGPMLLRKMADTHPDKYAWFAKQEESGNRWRSDCTYKEIQQHKLQLELNWDDFADCDSGQCGL